MPPDLRPPRLPAWLLGRVLHPVDADVVLGDLEETYAYLAERHGRGEARRWYWSQAARSVPPLALRALHWGIVMLRNYLLVALRAVRKQRVFSAINVAGLALGLAVCLLIVLFVVDEVSYDRFHPDVDRLLRVERTYYARDGAEPGTAVNDGFVLAPTLVAEVPEIEHATRFHIQPHYLRAAGGGAEPTEEVVAFTDAAFFQVLTFPLLAGDAASVLADPNGAVLTERAARKHFPDALAAVGRPVQLLVEGAYRDFTVTGVVETPPSNSSVRFDVAVRYERYLAHVPQLQALEGSWDLSFVQTYARLRPGAERAAVEAQLAAFTARHRAADLARMREQEGWGADETPMTYTVRPITAVHFQSESRPLYAYLLAGLALGILAMACINFTTLAIGRSARRAREVGVRKVVGAHRSQIMGQFWSEAFVMSALAGVAGLALAAALLPIFNRLTEKTLTFGAAGMVVAALAALALLAGLLAGSYPALVFSSFQPVEAFRGRTRISGGRGLTRVLVVVQFALSAFLLVGALVMGRQVRYLAEKDLGFTHERVVSIPAGDLDAPRVAALLRERLAATPHVVGVTASGNTFGYRGNSGMGFEHEGRHYTVDIFPVETNHLDFFDLELVAGRAFDPALTADTTEAILVNEALVRTFELDDPLGRQIPGLEERVPARIVGVVRDYQFNSLYQTVGPMMLTLKPYWGFRYLFVRLGPDAEAGLAALRTAWADVSPDVPLAYQFLDDEMAEVYALERRWTRVARYGAFFALVIACLGLLGLTALSVAGRTKEIGIRKVMGASARQIVGLLARDFGVLVGVGFVIAAPLAVLALRQFLTQYAYRVEWGAGVFLVAAAVIGLLAAATVGVLAYRAALRDPVHSLRQE